MHVGQDDMPVADARREVGAELLIGLSTHSPAQLEAGIGGRRRPAQRRPGVGDADQAGAAGRRARVRAPGGGRAGPTCRGSPSAASTRSNVTEVVDAGAERVVVVRAIRDAADPRAAAAELRAALERGRVGAAQ